MFKRRKPLTLLQIVREAFWPSMGIKRSIIYIKHRLLRVADTSHSIALGLAIGFGVSFTPLLGTHFIQAGCIAYVCRGNIFSAMMGTFVGNPWTFPFFWWSGYSFGSFLFGFFGIEGTGTLPEDSSLSVLWEIVKTQPLTLFLPWMLGGYILCAAVVPLVYPVYFFIVRAGKAARRKALALRAAELKALKKKIAIKVPKDAAK